MLTNRLVRALVGAVIAQASVAAAWYVYKKEQKLQEKQEQDSSEDLNSLENNPSVKTVEVTDGSEQSQEVEAIQEVNETAPAVVASKPKRVRKPKATTKEVPNETTVAAIAEAEQIVQEKKARRTTPVKKDMFVAPEATSKPARKRTPAKKAETVVEPQAAQKPARKRATKKQA